MDLQILAIIPARGGSKSIPRKNIQPLAGHPLLAYSIAAGRQAESVTRVIVSTDDEEIATIAREYGAEVPFLRPASLAQDDTSDLPVIEHALEWLARNGSYVPDIVVHLRPTSPLRPPDCIDQAVAILKGNMQADSVRGVIPSGQNPFKMWRITANGVLEALMKHEADEPYNMPRQLLPQTYWQTGHIDAIRHSTIESGTLTGTTILPLILDSRYAVDIDTHHDHERAEWLIRNGDVPLVLPGKKPRPLPREVKMLLLDFDGVLTDNRVWVDSDGRESVAAHRGDGWGIARLKEQGVRVLVVSTESNPVVTARCQKLGIEVVQNVHDKAAAVEALVNQEDVDPDSVVFVGNDENDLPAFSKVGCAIVVSDAHPIARAQADIVLRKRGGFGAVREVCDMILERTEAVSHDG